MVVAVKREGNVYTFNVEHERVMVAEHKIAENKVGPVA